MPVGIAAALSMCADGIALVQALSRARGNLTTTVSECVKVLKEIYFTPRGVRILLEKVAGGDRPSVEEIQAILIDFNDVEDRIRTRSSRLLDVEPSAIPDLSIRQQEQLSKIMWAKLNLRSSIQGMLNSDWEEEPPLTRQEAGVLLFEIKKLNEIIKELEDELIKMR